jgi:RNA polymerase sigma-70 factor (ECF subfamily)
MMPNSRLMNDNAQGSAAVSDLDDIDGLVQTYRPRVLAFAFYRLRDMDLAETVTQECFMRAFEKRDLFRGDCSVSTWLLAIVANLIRDHTRSARFRFWKMASASAVDPKTMENHRALRQRSPESMLMARDDLRTVWGIVNRFRRNNGLSLYSVLWMRCGLRRSPLELESPKARSRATLIVLLRQFEKN